MEWTTWLAILAPIALVVYVYVQWPPIEKKKEDDDIN